LRGTATMEDSDYSEINKTSWNSRVQAHLDSNFYDNASFLEGRCSLNEIELKLLGDIKGKSILHLQCHFGQDTISLDRLGGDCLGIDFSNEAIDAAKEIADATNSKAKFLCCDVYTLPELVNEKFDMVFTSYGVLGWLPDMKQWANVVSNFLKPEGQLILVEFHPFLWMFDDNFKTIKYGYFNTGPIVETETGTYADKNAPITEEYVMWNHSIGEVMTSLLSNGLSIDSFKEFDYSPYNCFNETVCIDQDKYRIKHLDDKIPMVYSLVANKNK